MMGFTRETASNVQRALVAGLIVSMLCAALAITLCALVFHDAPEDVIGLAFGAPALLALMFLLLVVFVAVLRREPRLPLQVSAIVGATIGTVAILVTVGIMLLPDRVAHPNSTVVEALLKATVSGMALAVALAYTGLLALIRAPSGWVRAMAIGTGVSAWLMCGLLLFLLLAVEPLRLAHDFGTFIALVLTESAFTMLTLIGTVALPIAMMSKSAKRRHAAESIDARVRVHFGCPKCAARQTHRPGLVQCIACGASMLIEVEEPRCECGYLLYQLTGDACPECGRPIAEPHPSTDATRQVEAKSETRGAQSRGGVDREGDA